jgi:uncharacterized protein
MPNSLRPTRLLILQGTPFCNINCDYCYLPDRVDRRRMSVDTIRQVSRFIVQNKLAADDMTIAWHAGEPLVLPPAWYRDAISVLDEEFAPHRYPYAIQTNATLVTDLWCDLLREHRFHVGVSIDGPAFLHDARRRTRSGGPTHARVMQGVARLRAYEIPFYVICVITRATLDVPDALMDFFLSHDLLHIGFNIEEIENANLHSSLAVDDVARRFRLFYSRIIDRALASPRRVELREVENLADFFRHPLYSIAKTNALNNPFEIITIAWNGDIVTFSPELAGKCDSRYNNFVIGNVASDDLASITQRHPFTSLSRAISLGIEACRVQCPYFNVCLGGAPSNKLAEHGRFECTETLHCKLTTQVIVDTILDRPLTARL